METFVPDIAPAQVVRWLLEEQRHGRAELELSATRSYEAAAVADRELRNLGDEERDELSDILEIGTLEISPAPGHARWTLHIRVEDDIGARVPEDESAPAGEEEIDLQAFHDEFIATPRGTIAASVAAESPAAKAAFTKFIEAILTDRHGQ